MPDLGPREVLYSLQEEPGILRPPLSAEQIQAALLFGSTFYSKSKDFDNDPYTQWLPNTGLLITLGTAFGRIAAYGGVCARTGERPDPSIVEQINLHPLLGTHYQMQSMSKHRLVSCIVIGGPSHMEYMERGRYDKNYTESWAFPYPPNLGDLMSYELFIPRFVIFGLKDYCVFDFGILR
jgi:hypothetical protein